MTTSIYLLNVKLLYCSSTFSLRCYSIPLLSTFPLRTVWWRVISGLTLLVYLVPTVWAKPDTHTHTHTHWKQFCSLQTDLCVASADGCFIKEWCDAQTDLLHQLLVEINSISPNATHTHTVWYWKCFINVTDRIRSKIKSLCVCAFKKGTRSCMCVSVW